LPMFTYWANGKSKYVSQQTKRDETICTFMFQLAGTIILEVIQICAKGIRETQKSKVQCCLSVI